MVVKNVRPGLWAHDVPDDPGGPIVPLVQVVGSGGQPGGAQDINLVSPNPLPVQINAGVTPVNRSGTIAAGGTAQQLAAANPDRQGFWIQNLSAEDLWINDLGAATTGQPSWKIPPDALYEAPITGVTLGALSIIGATTGQAFAAREW